MVCFQGSWGALTAASMAYAVQATTHYQTYPRGRPGADLPSTKSVQFGPDGAPFP